MKHLLLIFAILYYRSDCYAQHLYPVQYSYLDSANVNYCRGNVRASIGYLEDFLKNYPKDVLSVEAAFCLGEIYQAEKDYALAIPLYHSVLNSKDSSRERMWENYTQGRKYQPNFDTLFPVNDFEERTCFQLVESGSPIDMKYRSCMDLYEIYLNMNVFDSCLTYLEIARNEYMPNYGGCVNGMRMELAFIANKEAQVYLLKRDTSNAIKGLLSTILYDEGESSRAAHKTLIELIHIKYSKSEIDQVLDEAIQSAHYASKNGYKQPVFFIFGHEIRIWAWEESDEKLREWLRKNPYLQKLRKE